MGEITREDGEAEEITKEEGGREGDGEEIQGKAEEGEGDEKGRRGEGEEGWVRL